MNRFINGLHWAALLALVVVAALVAALVIASGSIPAPSRGPLLVTSLAINIALSVVFLYTRRPARCMLCGAAIEQPARLCAACKARLN